MQREAFRRFERTKRKRLRVLASFRDLQLRTSLIGEICSNFRMESCTELAHSADILIFLFTPAAVLSICEILYGIQRMSARKVISTHTDIVTECRQKFAEGKGGRKKLTSVTLRAVINKKGLSLVDDPDKEAATAYLVVQKEDGVEAIQSQAKNCMAQSAVAFDAARWVYKQSWTIWNIMLLFYENCF